MYKKNIKTSIIQNRNTKEAINLLVNLDNKRIAKTGAMIKQKKL